MLIKMNGYYCVIFALLIFIVFLRFGVGSIDNFHVKKVMGSPCKIDSDCGNDEFCYMGQCWGYWRGVNMPWSTCRNPYCGSNSKGLSCAAAQGKCSPYCKCQLNRRLGTTIDMNCFPKCGSPCLNNDECPAGCPVCRHGLCSAPDYDSQPVL